MLSTEHEQLLKKIYYDQSMFLGRDKLYDYVASKYPDDHPSRRAVMEWLKNQTVHQLHFRPPPRLPTKSVVSSKPLRYFQVDLTGPLPRNQGYSYIFGMIDVHSKMLYAAPLKTKTSAETARILEEIIQSNDLHIRVIQHDSGSEFLREFQTLLRSLNIKQVTSQPHSPWTNGNIERVWGTLKQMLFKYQTVVGSNSVWVDILPKLVSNYNNAVHSATGISPVEAERGGVVQRVQKPLPSLPVLKVGDQVRLRLRQDASFEKKSKQYFSSELYKVSKVTPGNAKTLTTYKLQLDGVQQKGVFNVTDLLHAPKTEGPALVPMTRAMSIQGQAEVDRLIADQEAWLDQREDESVVDNDDFFETMSISAVEIIPEIQQRVQQERVRERVVQQERAPVRSSVTAARGDAVFHRWLQVLNKEYSLQLTSFPATVFKLRVSERGDGRKDRYLYVAAHLPQPERGAIRSIPDLERYLLHLKQRRVNLKRMLQS
jgi:hypothetical protein